MIYTVLVVEDDAETRAFLASGLEDVGYRVLAARDGIEGLALATGEVPPDSEGSPALGVPDAIVLDRMLPGLDGLALLGRLRARGFAVPVIILSAIGSTDERVRGLKSGSDDYLVKPFAMPELLARLEIMLRRTSGSTQVATRLTCGDLELDLLSSQAMRAGKPLMLQPRALKLLEYLMRNQDRVVTRSMILRAVWNYDFDPGTNVIDVYVSNVRKEVDGPGQARLLRTVRGVGYRFGQGVP